jgi:hypothetical protein
VKIANLLVTQRTWPSVTPRIRARNVLTCLLVALAGPLTSALAGEAKEEGGRERVDTEFIFGFTAGADTGEVGENALEHTPSPTGFALTRSAASGSTVMGPS